MKTKLVLCRRCQGTGKIAVQDIETVAEIKASSRMLNWMYLFFVALVFCMFRLMLEGTEYWWVPAASVMFLITLLFGTLKYILLKDLKRLNNERKETNKD